MGEICQFLFQRAREDNSVQILPWVEREMMIQALRDYVVLGDVTTNIAYLQDLLGHPAFREGNTATNFIERHLAAWQPTLPELPDELLCVAQTTDSEILCEGCVSRREQRW